MTFVNFAQIAGVYVVGACVAMALNALSYGLILRKGPLTWDDVTFLAGGSWIIVFIQVIGLVSVLGTLVWRAFSQLIRRYRIKRDISDSFNGEPDYCSDW